MPVGQTSVVLVPVGDAGNAPDTRIMSTIFSDGTTGYGRVTYNYQIDKYDVTAAQYATFLNAVARNDTYGLFNSNMAAGPNTVGLTRNGNSGSYSYTATAGHENQAMNYVTWGDAVRFANWLTNGQPNTGSETLATTEDGSYFLNGATSNADLLSVTRKSTALYAVPSEDEWYKAAYYKGGSLNAGYWDYATQNNAPPASHAPPGSSANSANYYGDPDTGAYFLTGSQSSDDAIDYLTDVGAYTSSQSAYGTFDQTGELYQWNESHFTNVFLFSDSRGLRGGSWGNSNNFVQAASRESAVPALENPGIGFRIVAVPEPASLALLMLAGCIAIVRRRDRRC